MTDMPKTKKPPVHSSATIFADYYTQLTQYIVRRIGNSQDANDLVQEIFEQFIRAERANPTEVVKDAVKYIFGIAAHVVYDHLNSASRERDRLIVDSEIAERLSEQLLYERPDYLAERLSEERSLLRALTGLPSTQRHVLVLTSRDGLSYAEVARLLHISLDTVKKYSRQARAKLRMRWKRADGR